MKIVLFTTMLLSLSFCKTYAETPCERAKQHASSTAQLVALAAANGITISKEDQKQVARCFKTQKRKHR